MDERKGTVRAVPFAVIKREVAYVAENFYARRRA